ncbi:hypothetical protein [Vibrio hannami]|uniref:hypothetical protein n=1 Tax=Vibrio hannami TaxID=2717094 RepID=UPI003BB0D492
MHQKPTIRLLFAYAVFAITTSTVHAESELNLTKGVTDISEKVYELHMLIFYICCAIAAVVFGIMFYSIFKHRKSKGAVAADFH